MSYNYNQLTVSAKKAVSLIINGGNPASIKTSRYQTQIKAVEVSYRGDLGDLLEVSGLTGTLTDLSSIEEKNISGKYKAKLFTTAKAAKAFSKEESFLIVNTFTEKGSLKTKDLAPDKLGLTVYTDIKSFDKAISSGIENLVVDEAIKFVLSSLHYDIQQFKSNNSDVVPFSKETKELMSVTKPQDKQAIGKDFGEILSLRWYITQKFAQPLTKFGFSAVSNEALIDFYVIHGKITSNVSAKFEAGAAPSIGSIVKNIDKVYKSPTSEEKKAIDVLKALAGEKDNTSTKILNAYKTLKLPALAKLQSTIKANNTFTTQDISNFIQQIAKSNSKAPGRVKIFKEVFQQFYSVLNKTASDDSLNTVFSAPTYKKYYSLVMSPMGYALVDYMNKTPIYQDILNNISRSMKTEQVYLDFSSSGMVFKKKLFSKAEFKFAYGANAKDSDNTGIKFSMK